MARLTEFKCPACELDFEVDLRVHGVMFCPLCGYQRPQAICSQCGSGISGNAEVREMANELREKLGSPDPS